MKYIIRVGAGLSATKNGCTLPTPTYISINLEIDDRFGPLPA
jgi:hypothetical protein